MTTHELLTGIYRLGINVPKDMWNIEETYYSNSKAEYINVRDMDVFHLIRAFCKQIRNDVNLDLKTSISALKGQITDLENKIEDRQ